MHFKINQLILSVLIILVAASCQQKEQSEKSAKLLIPDTNKLDEVLNHYVSENFYPFIYARLEDLDGQVIYEHSAVNEKLLPNTNIDGNSWIRIWSMSKIVTISLVLDLVEDGILKLNDPVTKYIPEFENLKVAVSESGKSLVDFEWGKTEGACPIRYVENDSVMTVLQLINHKAGFYYATTGFECVDSLMAAQNLPRAKNSDELIQRMAKLPIVQQPGSKYFYGMNTTVLGLVAERATGKTLKELIVERVTDPMKIEGLQYGLPNNEKLIPKFTCRDSILRKAKKGELDIFGPDVPDYALDHELYLGGEGMVATADGYADFIRMLLQRGTLNGHRFLEKETVEDIYAPHTQTDNAYGHNGYNLWVSSDSMRINNQGDAGLWIGGGYECTHFWADPHRNFVGIIMSQNHEVRAPGYELNDKFRGELYRQLLAEEN